MIDKSLGYAEAKCERLIGVFSCFSEISLLHVNFFASIRNGAHFTLHTVSQKKNIQNCFSHNFVNCLLNLIIFGTKMAKMIKSCNVHSFPTSPNLCQCTTV